MPQMSLASRTKSAGLTSRWDDAIVVQVMNRLHNRLYDQPNVVRVDIGQDELVKAMFIIIIKTSPSCAAVCTLHIPRQHGIIGA